MPVQKENTVVNPQKTIKEDYNSAVIHLAWDWDKQIQQGTLIFAMVELLPLNIVHSALETDVIRKQLDHSGNHYVNMQQYQVVVDEAIKWYEACREGAASELKSNNPREYKLALLSEEPAWPRLTTAIDSDLHIVPFLADWHRCPRLHHLIPVQEDFITSLWNAEQQDKALTWLSEHLFFDFKDYPELLGSIHLIAPNPVFNGLDIKEIPGYVTESVLLKFYLWPGQAVDGLELSVRDIRPTGAVNIRNINLTAPALKIDFGHEIYKLDISITCPRRGVLFWNNPVSFIRSISLNANVQTARRKMILTDETRESSLERETNIIHPDSSTIIGKEQPLPPALEAIVEAQKMRRRRSDAKHLDQYLFSEQADEAETFVRGVIGPARKRVLIVDPYFTTLYELIKFGLAPERPSVSVQILTSGKGFKQLAHEQCIQKSSEGIPDLLKLSKNKFEAKDYGKIFDQFCQELSKQSRTVINTIEIKVMTGKEPDVHDRFIVADNNVWLIGSSLNKFGKRLTTTVRLPDPDPVRNALERVWNEAEDLHQWIQDDRNSNGQKKWQNKAKANGLRKSAA